MAEALPDKAHVFLTYSKLYSEDTFFVESGYSVGKVRALD